MTIPVLVSILSSHLRLELQNEPFHLDLSTKTLFFPTRAPCPFLSRYYSSDEVGVDEDSRNITLLRISEVTNACISLPVISV